MSLGVPMLLVDAIDVLKGQVHQQDQVLAAFHSVLRGRDHAPIFDLFQYRDFLESGGVYLPPSRDWAVDVDIIGKPKQSGGLRFERWVDICTATLLQTVAERLANAAPPSLPAYGIPFMPARREGPLSYEAWANALTAWLRQHLTAGHSVLLVDVADYFPSIRPDQIHRAIIGRGLSPEVADATLLLFDRVNCRPARDGKSGIGLPIIADDIAWIVADLVLRPFDDDAQRLRSVRGFGRWIDDCFIACDPDRAGDTLRELSETANAHGFRFNPNKTRVLRSLDDLNRVLLQSEHELLHDLLQIASAGAGEIELSRFLPQLRARLVSGGAEDTRLVKRIYALAAMTRSPIMLSSAEQDLRDYPVAERQILSYLSRLDWPPPSLALLLRSLAGDHYDSRQLLTLRLILESPPAFLPAAPRDVCVRIVSGALPAHEFARPLALASSGERSIADLRRVADAVAKSPSAMARRVTFEMLSIVDEAIVNWPALSRDLSPLVRRLAEVAPTLEARWSGLAIDGLDKRLKCVRGAKVT
jgi:hypothetical protein